MASSKWTQRAVMSGGGLAVAGALAFGAYSFPQVLPKSLANLIRPTAVTTALVQVAPVSEAVYGTGTVEPERWAKVVPLQRRRLVEICRCEGQAVKAGQILARQDDAEERNVLQELEINHEQLDRNLRRAQTDRSKGDITAADLEQRETAFDQSKSRIAAQRSRLDTLVLRAPMDGLVLRRDGEVGEIVGPTEVPFWVGQPTPLHVVAEINEEEIVKVAVGQKVFLRTEAFEGQALRADVSQITPKGDPTRKTFRVYLRLPQQTPLRIGMTVEANIIFREKQAAMVVPAESVVANAVQEVDSDGRLRRVPVKIGVKGSRSVEVAGDLSRGAVVLSPGRPDLAERTKVASSNEPEETAVASTPGGANNAPPDRDMHPAGAQAREVQPPGEPEDYHTSALRSAVSAHIESVVLDARRNVHKYDASAGFAVTPRTKAPPLMNLLFGIAWTHVRTRVRQTLVGTFGVSIGVGFTIMMAGLMQGSQTDFLQQLVDAMPHITVTDDTRTMASQPAEQVYAAVGLSNAPNVNRRAGIKTPDVVVASLESWLPGAVAASVKVNAIVSQGPARVGVSLTGIDPRTEAGVSKLATQMREGQLSDLVAGNELGHHRPVAGAEAWRRGRQHGAARGRRGGSDSGDGGGHLPLRPEAGR